MSPIWFTLPLAYLAGILLAGFGLESLAIMAGITLMASLYCLKQRPYWWSLCLATGLVCMMGTAWTIYRSPKITESNLAYWAPQKNIEIQGVLTSSAQNKAAQRWQWDLEATGFRIPPAKDFTAVKGRLRVSYKEIQPALSPEHLLPGDQLRLSGQLVEIPEAMNPGAFSYQRYLNHKEIYSLFYARKIDQGLSQNSHPGWFIHRYMAVLRQSMVAKLEQNLPEETAHLMGSLILGEQASPVSDRIKAQFQAVGLQHVLAVSGFQVQLLVFSLLGFGQIIRLPRLLNVCIALVFLWFFVGLTGAPASVMRAAAVASLALWAYLYFKQIDTLYALILGCSLLLIYDPHLLWDIGFQFSALATFGLISSSQKLAPRLDFLPLPISTILVPILIAQTWVLPAQMFHFGTFSWLFLPANLIAGLFTTALTWLALAGLLSAYLLPWIQALVLAPAELLISLFLLLLQKLMALPQPLWHLRPWAFSMTWMSYSLLLLLTFEQSLLPFMAKALNLLNDCTRQQKQIRAKILSVQISLALLFSLPLLHTGRGIIEQKQCPVRVTYLYVGQGDAILIEANHQNILIDAGPRWQTDRGFSDAGERHILPYLHQRGIKSIDLAVLSHAHLDHYGGFFSLAEYITIKEFVAQPGSGDSKMYQDLHRQLETYKIPYRTAPSGSLMSLGPELDLIFWHSLDLQHSAEHSDLNNTSLVLELRHQNLDFLFAGDLEESGEEKLLAEPGFTSQNPILKVPHHGSKTSSTEAFLKQLKPREAIISVGQKNRFKHPSSEVIQRYQDLGIRTWRTDQQGAVCICSQGDAYQVQTTLLPTS